MTKIGLLSDSHGYLDERVFEHFKFCDQIWHAGDIGSVSVADELAKFKPLVAVCGNIDGHILRSMFPMCKRFMCEDVDVLLTHIGGYPGKYAKEIYPLLAKNPPKLFIAGHSHILKVQYDKTLNLLHINPGAEGKYGFHKVRTLVRFDINGAEIQNLEVIELA